MDLTVKQKYVFGTAGWSYKDWQGTVYPKNKPPNFNHLSFMADLFEFVEVNTTFYHIPSQKLTLGWVHKTEDKNTFTFWIKINQIFTHKRELLANEVSAFKSSLAPLINAKRLSGLIAQFPYSFKLNQENLNYLKSMVAPFSEFQLAVEFRHRSWDHNEIIDYFSQNKLIWVNIDQPVISLSLPLTTYMTNPDTSYFRLHGRNYQSWFSNQGRDARYDYSYSTEELVEISKKIKTLRDKASKIFISGNNHYQGNAVKNLIELKKILV